LAEEPQLFSRQAILSSFHGARSADAGSTNDNNAGILLEPSTSFPVLSDILSDSQSLTPDIVLSGKSSVFSPSKLIGELVSSDQVSDLSALSTPGAFSFTPGIVSVSGLSAAELAQSVIDKIQCPEGTIIWIGDTGASQHSSKSKRVLLTFAMLARPALGAQGNLKRPSACSICQGSSSNMTGHWDFGQSSRMFRTAPGTISTCSVSLACFNSVGL
jgi:hypothetical protein